MSDGSRDPVDSGEFGMIGSSAAAVKLTPNALIVEMDCRVLSIMPGRDPLVADPQLRGPAPIRM
jgi:hypothetical protein